MKNILLNKSRSDWTIFPLNISCVVGEYMYINDMWVKMTKTWRKYVNEKFLSVGQKIWIYCFGNKVTRVQEYLSINLMVFIKTKIIHNCMSQTTIRYNKRKDKKEKWMTN